MEEQSSGVFGIKHLFSLKNQGGYIRSVAAITGFSESYSEGYVDSSFIRKDSYRHSYNYPAFRFSSLLNCRLSSQDIIRTGINIHLLGARMTQQRIASSGKIQDLVEPEAFGILYQAFVQLKNRISEKIELNSGFHSTVFSVNKDISIEPRAGIKWQFLPGMFLNAGMGLHSRVESFPVYYNRISNVSGKQDVLNNDLGFMRSLQFVLGSEILCLKELRFRIEAYHQELFKVPVIDKKSSTWSSINTSEELPSSDLTNKGKGYNKGIELTIDKSFSHNYYALITFSLFDSRYRAGNGFWYNTYYNTRFAGNILCGKDFVLGGSGKNIVGLNTKIFARGGYRYTPVNYQQSEAAGRVIYYTERTYGARLPNFFRCDGGFYYRRNSNSYTWLIMVDVQNLSSRRNVFRKKFSWINSGVVESYVYSLGIVPVLNLRVEF
jgi:hypothetical protein